MAAEPPTEPMDAQGWSRVRRVLHRALEAPPELRAACLEEACEGDSALRAEVESLLAASERTSLLDRPMMPRQIGPYRVLEKIGEGGMGTVYKAIDSRLDRPVALKVLSDARGDWTQERRFAREAKAASALNHPNIVTVYEFDRQDGLDFIAMEYVQGTPLNTLLEQHTAPLGTLLEYARQAAGAIGKAHAAGIVHRDLKPGNMMITTDGVVKVLDFGLATLERPSTDPDATRTQALTREGMSVGTPSYMSPEQALGEPEDWRSDIFSLGVILYEIACGRRPFHGKNAHATMYQIVHEDPKPAAGINPAVPAALAALIGNCLRKRPEQRPQSMDEVARVLAGLVRPPVPEPPKRISRLWLWPALVIAALAIAAGLWTARNAGPPSGRVVAYAIEAQKMHDGLPTGDPYMASGGDAFEGGWRFRLRIRSPQSGYLYLINRGPGETGADRFWILYPKAPAASLLAADHELATEWYVFDRNPGTERVWIVWAGAPIDVLEKNVSGSSAGRVESQDAAAQVRRIVEGFTTGKRTPDPNGWIRVESRGPREAAVEQLELKHR